MTTEWSLDFCLVCDRQTLGGPYCSQVCRLAEVDASPDNTPSYTRESRIMPKTDTSLIGRGTTMSSSLKTTQTSYWNSYRPYGQKTLSPSSSQTSLSSLRSNSSQGSPISKQSQTELRDYASCFDHVRDLKRRLTS
ncbi:hypothetical protein BJX70DRAFT_49404 [Aspergillus crustosus]